MRRVRLVSDEWVSEASRPSNFIERFRGLRGERVESRLLFETSSVHTLGMTRAISVVMISNDRRVIRAQTLLPNRVVHERSARFILEMPQGSELPAIGADVDIVDV